LRLRLAADGVDNRIGAAGETSEIIGVDVDDFVGAQAVHVIGVAVADRGDDAQLPPTCQLQDVNADIAGRAVDDDGLAFSHRGMVEQHLPGHDTDHRHGGSLDVR